MRKAAFLPLLALVLAFCMIFCSCKGADEEADAQLPMLTIGSDVFEPYFYMNDQYTGVDIDIAAEACARLGYRAVFRQIKWQSKDNYLESGEVDCLWGCFTMNGREDRYTWAGPYMSSRQVVIVPEDSDIRTLSNLNGKRVAVQNSSKTEELFLSGGPDGKTELQSLYTFPTMANVVSAMKDEYVDACAGHENAYKSYMKDWDKAYRTLDEPLIKAELGVAFLKGTHTELAEKLTDVLRGMREDGSIAEILSKYDIDAEKALSEDAQ